MYSKKKMGGSDMFQSNEEVEVYLNGDRIECLECGKQYKSLGKHIVYAHSALGITRYKHKHGIPQAYSLDVPALREMHSRQAKGLWSDPGHAERMTEMLRHNNHSGKAKRGQNAGPHYLGEGSLMPEWKKEEAKARNGGRHRKYALEELENMLTKAISQRRPLMTVCRDETGDDKFYFALHLRVRNSPEDSQLRRLFREAIYFTRSGTLV